MCAVIGWLLFHNLISVTSTIWETFYMASMSLVDRSCVHKHTLAHTLSYIDCGLFFRHWINSDNPYCPSLLHLVEDGRNTVAFSNMVQSKSSKSTITKGTFVFGYQKCSKVNLLEAPTCLPMCLSNSQSECVLDNERPHAHRTQRIHNHWTPLGFVFETPSGVERRTPLYASTNTIHRPVVGHVEHHKTYLIPTSVWGLRIEIFLFTTIYQVNIL